MKISTLRDWVRELPRLASARLVPADSPAVADQDQHKVRFWVLGVVISVLGVIALALHLAKEVTFDTPALVLAFIVLAPWLALFLDNATLPGGWRLEFRRLETTQRRQRAELDTIKFLLENALTRWERTHLEALNAAEAFHYSWQKNFEAELTRLLALEFIERQSNKGFRSAKADRRPDNDLRQHFRVTDRGKDYLARLEERLEEADQIGGPHDRAATAGQPGPQ
jgi:hypothetical protein